MKYRAEIDGLRALAVVPVILFHAGFELFSGGFVGVDVFFVISGYLITTILIEDIEEKRFSLANFYERRARRILPALFFVMLVCIPFAWMWMLPSQMQDFSKSLIAVSIFASNVLFWRETGYFTSNAEEMPLLHTWSLAVEEQYYLLFPIFLFLSWRFGKKRVFWMIIAFAAMSLALSEWASRNAPTANFYLAPSRAWELLAGSTTAFIIQKRGVQASNTLSMLGLGAVLLAIFAYDEKTPFPSVYTLLPVFGVVLLVLFAAKETLVSKLLSARLLVGIGLISYSAYLWHQPLFAFARIRYLEPSGELISTLSGIAMLLGYLSWRYVEQPFRKMNAGLLSTRRSVFIASFSLFALATIFGYAGYSSEGFPIRTMGGNNLAIYDERVEPNYGLHSDCEGIFNNSPNCRTSESPNVLLWGDSFAMHLAQGLLSSNPEIGLQQHTLSACSPILGISRFSKARTKRWADRCIDFNEKVFSSLQDQSSVNLVVISSSFEWVGEGHFIDQEGNTRSANVAEVMPYLEKTIRKIQSLEKSVVIVSPAPRSRKNVGKCLTQQELGREDVDCDFKLNLSTPVQELLATTQINPLVYWLHDDICSRGSCSVKEDGLFIYRDNEHLSKEGSAYLGKKFNWYEKFRRLQAAQ